MDDTRLRKKPPKILLTSFDLEERRQLANKIRHIGGILYESSNFTALATHIVCKIPSKSEKFMCACAAGKWILSQSYVEESYNQKQWLDERSFEWSAKDYQGDPLLRELFLLPKKWREQFESQNGAFNNWTVVLVFKNEKRKELFKRLIEAGKGRILNLKPPYHRGHMKIIKYAISEDIKSKELLPFRRACVPVVDPDAIINYIIKGKKPNGSIIHGMNAAAYKKKQCTPPNQMNQRTPSSSSSSFLKHKNNRNSQSNGQKKVQLTLKNFFIGLKSDSSLSMERSPCSERGNVSCSDHNKAHKQMSSAKKKIKPDSLVKSGSKIGKHSAAKNSSSEPLVCLEKVTKLTSNCRKELFLSKDVSLGSLFKDVININDSPVKRKVSSNCTAPERNTNTSPVEKKTFGCKTVVERATTASPDKTKISSNGTARGTEKNVPHVSEKIESKAVNKGNDLDVTVARRCKQSNQNASDSCDAVPVGPIKQPLSKRDTLHISPAKLASPRRREENVISKQIVSPNKSPNNLSNVRLKGSRKRQRHEDDTDLPMQNRSTGPKRRSSRRSSVPQPCNVKESPAKRLKLYSSNNVAETNHGSYAEIMDPLTIEDMHQRRMPLHRYGIDSIESCLEESLQNEAVKLMASYLSPKYYLTSKMISVLMNILKPSSNEQSSILVFSIRSILNRCIVLHPPQTLPAVYVASFKMSAEKGGESSKTDDAFDYITSVFREALSLLKESGDIIKKQAVLGLLSFITAVVETDFNFHRKRYEAGQHVDKQSRKSILSEIVWCKVDHHGNGTNVKKILKLAVEIAIESLDKQELVPLRRMVFSLVHLIGQCCQVNDVNNLSTSYGTACTDFTNEFYQIVNNMTANNCKREKILSIIFASLKLEWLAARLADLFIGSYDVTCIRGTARQLLRKPLSLEKIVNCYFFLIPAASNEKIYFSNRKSPSKPLAIIGDTNTESARLNVKRTAKQKNSPVKRNVKGETKLHVACIKNKPANVKQLMLRGVDPNIKDNAGWTALHEASNHGHHSCVAELLSFKEVDVFATGMNGYTALHDASQNNHIEVVKLLIKAGGMLLLNMKTEREETAYDLARTASMKDLITEMEDEMRCDSLTPYVSPSVVKSEDINRFLALLAILLRHFLRTADKKTANLSAKVNDLKAHIHQLQQRPTKKSALLLNIVRNLLL